MCWRAGGEYIHYEAFIVSFHRKIHRPFVIRRPMPVKDVLAIGMPVELNSAPKFIDARGKCFFFLVSVFEVLTDTKQTLCEIRCFNEVATVVTAAEWFRFTCFTIPPVRPHSMEVVCLFEPAHKVLQAFKTLLARNKISLNPHKYRHHTEAGPSRCDNMLVILRIHIVGVKPFTATA